MGLIRFTIKTSIVGGIVYYTCQEGLWSKPEDTAKLYGKLYTNVAPYVKHNLPKEVIDEYNRLPSVTCITNCAKQYWNEGVLKSMKFISNLPTHATNGATSLSETVQKYMKESAQ
ncbi:PREDICTED: uncharacterized protein LOC107194272 [Dufourea novaeangliae]|uniref:uncharacterized protein LOC107194272 n=1 Tax=Dufourea novaeangliae TaxID=178035 RepID=UPI000767CF43|nr:PREDICTED: uncharacterized protein LOC107194272 [Dufourea novaeangliae]